MYKLAFTCGVWDFLHAGHVSFLRDCKDYCDHLCVGLQTRPYGRDSKNWPVQSTFERFMQLQACKYVDTVVPYDTEDDLTNVLAIINPEVRLISDEYDTDELRPLITGLDVMKDLAIDLVFIPRRYNYSSSELRNRVQERA